MAILAFTIDLSGAVQEFFSQVVAYVLNLAQWFLDPTTLLTVAAKLFGWLVEAIAFFMPGDMGYQVAHLGETMGDVPFRKMFALGCYFASPVIDPDLLAACVGIRVNTWVVTRTVRFVVYVKGIFWSSQA
jgi:hypothetical protein